MRFIYCFSLVHCLYSVLAIGNSERELCDQVVDSKTVYDQSIMQEDADMQVLEKALVENIVYDESGSVSDFGNIDIENYVNSVLITIGNKKVDQFLRFIKRNDKKIINGRFSELYIGKSPFYKAYKFLSVPRFRAPTFRSFIGYLWSGRLPDNWDRPFLQRAIDLLAKYRGEGYFIKDAINLSEKGGDSLDKAKRSQFRASDDKKEGEGWVALSSIISLKKYLTGALSD